MHADAFLREAASIADSLDRTVIEEMAERIEKVRFYGGHLYIIGLGGSAANASHAAADFRKLCEIKAQAPTDSVAEFSARVNDEGFERAFTGWLWTADRYDALLVLSVGGGTEIVSKPITQAVHYMKAMGLTVLGIVGPQGGVTAELGDVVLKVPAPGKHITPQTEAFQMVVIHCLVSHPLLQRNKTKW